MKRHADGEPGAHGRAGPEPVETRLERTVHTEEKVTHLLLQTQSSHSIIEILAEDWLTWLAGLTEVGWCFSWGRRRGAGQGHWGLELLSYPEHPRTPPQTQGECGLWASMWSLLVARENTGPEAFKACVHVPGEYGVDKRASVSPTVTLNVLADI